MIIIIDCEQQLSLNKLSLNDWVPEYCQWSMQDGSVSNNINKRASRSLGEIHIPSSRIWSCGSITADYESSHGAHSPSFSSIMLRYTLGSILGSMTHRSMLECIYEFAFTYTLHSQDLAGFRKIFIPWVCCDFLWTVSTWLCDVIQDKWIISILYESHQIMFLERRGEI